MKKRAFIIAVLLLLTIFFALGGRYYFLDIKTDKIISLEIPPYSDEIVLRQGETAYEEYFEVIYKNGFSVSDISFISQDESVAAVKYSVTDRNRYVCFKVTAKSVGETYIFFSADGGEITSEKIKVTVLPATADNTEVVTEKESEAVSEVTGVETEKTTENSTENYKEPKEKNTSDASDKNHGNKVYITPYGKRYHYSQSCAGKNAEAATKNSAISSGRTPCKKCAGG